MQRTPGPQGQPPGRQAPVDPGSTARTRHHAPAHRHRKPKPQFDPHRPLTPDETSILQGLDAAKIVDLNERAMFLAQMSHESQDFTKFRENLHYGAPRLLALFPSHFDDLADAEKVVAAGPDEIAESIYGGRADLGNTTDGDGSRYVGRGYIQLTGKDAYTRAGTALKLDLVNHPELAEDKANALRIALWFWGNRQVGPPARKGEVRSVTKIINGKLNGLPDRVLRYDRYHQILDLLPHPAAPPATASPATRTALP